MATIKDIARLAKVSQGTVSNVLNGRGNVSLERILLVHEAAEQLGYVVNAQAKQLRADAFHSDNIAIILPNIEEESYASLFDGAKRLLEQNGHRVLLFVTSGSPYREKQIVNQAAELRVAGVITVTCCLTNPELYRPIIANGGKLLYALRDMGDNTPFVGFDFRQIGLQVGQKLASDHRRRIGVLTGPTYFPDNRDLTDGLLEALEPTGAALQIVRTDEATFFSTPFEFFENHSAPDVLVLSSERMLEKAQLAASVGSLLPCPPIVLLSQSRLCPESSALIHYYLDFVQVGKAAATSILEQLQDLPPRRELISPQGFRLWNPTCCPSVRKPISLCIQLSKGQSGTALIRMAPAFTRETGICLEFDTRVPSEMHQAALDTAHSHQVDVLRSSMSSLSLFPEDLFLTLDESVFSSLTEGMLPSVVRDFSKIGGRRQAVPFDIGSELLVYRKDLFEDPLLKRMYYEKTGKNLNVPTSFDEYAQVARFFDRRENTSSPVCAGTGIAVDSVVELFSSFILRYLNYTGNTVFQRGHTPVDVEAVCKCVQNLSFCGRYALPVLNLNWIGATLDKFVHGETAMEIVYLNYASDIIQLQKNTYGGQIGYATLPGGRTYITGGSLLIPKSSQNKKAALDFIRWACHPEQAELFTLLGGISPYSSVYKSNHVLGQYPWYQDLPSVIHTAYGRDLWDTLHVNALERRCFPILRSLVQNQLDSAEASVRLTAEMQACLL